MLFPSYYRNGQPDLAEEKPTRTQNNTAWPLRHSTKS